MAIRGIMLALCVALACGPGRGPARPDPLVGRIKRYQPGEMRSDARRADQAVILGIDDAGNSLVLAIPANAKPLVVDAMTVGRGAPSAAAGATVAITLTAAPNTAVDGALRVSSAGGAGLPASWGAGLWSAALVTAAALGKDVADLALSATPAGNVEDATASALLAAGFVAALVGDTVNPAAAVTGMLEPDGAIGPAAGIPEQIAAAIAHGKTRIGYPAGMRLARSAVTGKEVDLVQLARDRHAEAIEVAGLHDAYVLLTGHRLPAPAPVSEAAMALDPATLARLEARYQAWQRRLAEEWAPLLQLEQAGRLPTALVVMVRTAHDRSQRATALHRAGKLAAAHGDMLAAWAYAAAANQTHVVIARLAAGDVAGATAVLTALDPGDAGLRSAVLGIGAAVPATVTGHLAAIAALQAALRGWAFHDLAADSLRATLELLTGLQGKSPADLSSPATVEQVASAVAPTALRLLREVAGTTIAAQELELASDRGIACTCAPASVARVAAGFQAAAAAALGHVEALLVEPLARKAGIPVEAARSRIEALEPDYLIASRLSRPASQGLPHDLAAAWGDGSLGAGLLALAGSRTAYHAAALVIAKYDSLDIHVDDAGRIDAVTHPPALRQLLVTAERTARAAAHAAQVASGAIPVQARIALQLAAIEAAGNLDDQIDALAELWTATAFSEAAVMLARDCQ